MPERKPDHQRIRRNVPDLPWTDLPAGGRAEWPDCPDHLARPGQLWWARNWATPSATRWGAEEFDLAVRRAELHDMWSSDHDVKVLAEMRHLETALGLTAKARKELRWRIVDDGEVVELNGRRLSKAQRFKVVGAS